MNNPSNYFNVIHCGLFCVHILDHFVKAVNEVHYAIRVLQTDPYKNNCLNDFQIYILSNHVETL